MRTTRITLLGALAVLLLLPTASLARTNVAVGIGDQQASTFANPAFKALGVKKVRYFIRWDAAKSPGQLAEADAYVAAAKAAGARVLLHISSNDLRIKKAKLPSTASYSK